MHLDGVAILDGRRRVDADSEEFALVGLDDVLQFEREVRDRRELCVALAVFVRVLEDVPVAAILVDERAVRVRDAALGVEDGLPAVDFRPVDVGRVRVVSRSL